MKTNGQNDDINVVILRGISVSIVFGLAVLLIIAALFMFNTRGEFVGALNGEIRPSLSFYLYAVAVVFVSSILFTPFSFGISYYFINAQAGRGRFLQVFYMFSKPRLMLRAVLMNALKKLILSFWRLLTLIAAVIAECGVFVISVELAGENIFDYEQDFLSHVALFITHDRFFITLTVIEWCVVLVIFIMLNFRFIMCKYALLRYPSLGAVETIRVGVFSIRGKLLKTALFYLKYLSIYIFTFITMGRAKVRRDSFSGYAVSVVEKGIEGYYSKRS